MVADIVELKIPEQVDSLHGVEVLNIQLTDIAVGKIQIPCQEQILKRLFLRKIITDQRLFDSCGVCNILYRSLVKPFFPEQAKSCTGNGFLFYFIFFSTQLQPLLFYSLLNAPIIPYFLSYFARLTGLSFRFILNLS